MRKLFILLLILFVLSCKSESNTGEKYTDWDKRGGYADKEVTPYGPNAKGEEISLLDYEGDYVWVYYSAPWCSACRSQNVQMKKALKRFPDDVYFLNVLTSGETVRSSSTVSTAKNWAQTTGFPPEEVVAEGNSSRVIPQHALFSPNGTTLLRYVGFLPADKIIDYINKRKTK